MDSVFEKAVLDHFQKKSRGNLLIHNFYGDPDEMPLEAYFREGEEIDELHNFGLEICNGNILEVGAAVGSLSLVLQERGFRVDALEISNTFCKIMEQRGLKSIINKDFFSNDLSGKYDTLLILMNGFGVCGPMDRLPRFFKRFDELLAPGGQVIFDSSDVSYVYDGGVEPRNNYPGEIDYQYEYNGEKGEWFKWLYIDSDTLGKEALKNGFELQVISNDESGQYLGRLIRI